MFKGVASIECRTLLWGSSPVPNWVHLRSIRCSLVVCWLGKEFESALEKTRVTTALSTALIHPEFPSCVPNADSDVGSGHVITSSGVSDFNIDAATLSSHTLSVSQTDIVLRASLKHLALCRTAALRNVDANSVHPDQSQHKQTQPRGRPMVILKFT